MGDGIPPGAMKEFLKQQPIGRMGRPEEVAARWSGFAVPRRVSSWAWRCRSMAASSRTDAIMADGGNDPLQWTVATDKAARAYHEPGFKYVPLMTPFFNQNDRRVSVRAGR